MANLTFKQQDIASRSVDLATRLDDLVDEIEAFDAEYWQVQGITDDVLASAEPTAHLEANDFTTLLSRFEGLTAWINGSSNRDILRKARR